MSDVWSFNTTIRNPERMENMLRALSEMEGEPFDPTGQEKFFGLQIKKRLYKPEKITLTETDLIAAVHSNTSAEDLDDITVERIVQKYRGRNVDAAARGRTAAGILNRFGLCVAQQSRGPVTITQLGKKWLNNDIEDEELFTKFLLKWQYPNPIEEGYNSFNIKPFIAVLSLIQKVNKKWSSLGNKSVGLSKQEYQLFVPSLTKASDIETCVDTIISFRIEKRSKSGRALSEYTDNYANERARRIFGPHKELRKALSDLRDYADSSVRYFHMSGLIALRGKDTHVDIAKDKEVEAESVTATLDAKANRFESYEQYFAYLSDLRSLTLPWQNEDDLRKISIRLSRLIKEEAANVAENADTYLTPIQTQTPQQQVDALHDAINSLRIKKLRKLKHNTEVLAECMDKLGTITSRQYRPLTGRPSLDLEWYVTQSLMVLNDAQAILPSFKIGDDGLPTGFRANVSDIECYYESFGMTVEATTLLGRDQWYAEGQPVMRHLRDFEDKTEKDSHFCLFIAPLIHRDTLNTFWNSNKFSYEGKRQKIIPLTIRQFIGLLSKAKSQIESGHLGQNDLDRLLQTFAQGIDEHEDPYSWLESFPGYIDSWQAPSLVL